MKCKRKCMGKRVRRGIIAIALLLIFPYLFGGCGFAKPAEDIQVIGSDGHAVVISEKKVDATETEVPADDSQSSGVDSATRDVSAQQSATVCVVYVCGAVKHSGVYHLPSGARIVDAIEAAGGCTKNADAECLNQAEFVTDGQRLYIPKKGEQSQASADQNQINTFNNSQENETITGIESGKINLNTATKEQLMTLPGVGESKALAILAYRQEHGGFQSVDEIKKISGIKDGVYNKIKDSIVVG